MAEHIWSVLCNKSVIDRDSSQVSLFNALETLTVTSPEPLTDSPAGEKPAVQFTTEVVTLWRRSDPDAPEESECKLELATPDGTVVMRTASMKIDLSAHRRFRSTFQNNIFPILGEGTYRFNVLLKHQRGWEKAASLPLEVTIVIQEPQKQPERNKAKSKRQARKAKR